MRYAIPRKWSDKLLEADGLGVLRRRSFWTGETEAECVDGRRVTFSRAGLLKERYIVKDEADGEIGECRRRDTWGRVYDLSLSGAMYVLRKTNSWKGEYRLERGGDRVATVRHHGWGKDVITLDVESASPPDAVTLLFVAWVVRYRSERSGTAGAGG